MSWPEIKNMVILKCCLLSSYAATMNYFSMGLTCDEKQILLTTGGRPAQWLDWEEAPKHFPKSNLHQKKRSWSLFGGLLPVWSITAFLILAKPLHLRSMLSKSVRCTAYCNAYSQCWSTKRAQFFSMIMSDGISHTQCLKSWTNWSLVSSATFIWPLANQLPLHASWQLFAGKVLPQPEGCGKCFPRVSWIPEYRFLHYRNKQTYFSLAKMCWL